jgi:hypothetical protein
MGTLSVKDKRFGSHERIAHKLPKLEIVKVGSKRRGNSKIDQSSDADQTESQKNIVRELLDRRPFDFAKVKVILKKGATPVEEIYLDRQWTFDHIPHFRPVIEGVKKSEGIEITLTCNKDAFKFAIAFLKCNTDEE